MKIMEKQTYEQKYLQEVIACDVLQKIRKRIQSKY